MKRENTNGISINWIFSFCVGSYFLFVRSINNGGRKESVQVTYRMST